jgi:hypothetical protein
MAVAKTGSTYTWEVAAGNGSATDQTIGSITVPADASIAIVIANGYLGGSGSFDQLNWNGDDADIDFTHIVSQKGSYYHAIAYYMVSSDGNWPGSGSGKTLSFSFDVNFTLRGGAVNLFFLSGVDTGSPIGTTDTGAGEADWTSNDLSLSSGDMAIIAAGTAWVANTPDVTPTGAGQTEIIQSDTDNLFYGIAYEVDEDTPSIDGTGTGQGSIAFAVVAAVSGDISISVSDTVALTESRTLNLPLAIISVSDEIGVEEFRALDLPLGSISLIDTIAITEDIATPVGQVTVKESGGDYATLAAAVTAGETDISIEGAWTSAEAANIEITVAGTSIVASGAAKHPGWETTSPTHYRIANSSTGHVLTISADNVVIDGLDIKQNQSGASDECVRVNGAYTFTIKNSLLHFASAVSDQDGVYCSTGGAVLNVEQCAIWGAGRAAIHGQADSTLTINSNSNTLWDNGDPSISASEKDNGGISIKIQNAAADHNVNVYNTISMDGDNDVDANYVRGKDFVEYTYSIGSFAGTPVWNIHDSIDSNGDCSNRDGAASGCLESHNITDDNTKSSDGDWVIVEDITTNTDLRLQSNTYNEAQDMHANSSGAGLSIPALDIVGTSRPQNTNYDCGVFELVFGNLSLSVSDTVAVTEFQAMTMPMGIISIVDGIGAQENIGPDVPLAAITGIDNLTVTEVLSLLKDLVPSVFENIGITEFISILNQLPGISVSENIGLLENINAVMAALNTSIGDNIGVEEFITSALETILAVQEDIGVAETIAIILDLLKSATETISLTENISISLEGLLGEISAADTIALIENISLELEGLLGAISNQDIIAVIENIQASIELGAIAATDNIAVVEFISAAMGLISSVSDTIAVTENLSVLLELLTSVSEQIALIENIEIALEGILGAISNQDIIALTENIAVQLPGLTLSVSDSIGVLESITAVLPLSLTISDIIAISEYILVNLQAGASVIDTIALTENIAIQFDNLLLEKIENIMVSEFINIAVSGIVGKVFAAFTLARPGAAFTFSRPGAAFTFSRPGANFTLQ